MNIRKQGKFLKKAYEDIFEDIRKSCDLTMNEIIILQYLEQNSEKNTAKDLVNEVLATKSHISMSVEKLEKRGLIQKLQDLDDRKMFHLLLTEKSRQILDGINRRNEFIKRKITYNIPKENIAITEQTFKKISENIEKLILELNSKKQA